MFDWASELKSWKTWQKELDLKKTQEKLTKLVWNFKEI